jgi:predicted signal transduction protein with EAL and GGDEF domain
LANRIQASFRKSPFEIGGGRELDITCSVGLACYPLVPEKCEALSWEDVLAVADQGLYASKLSGRDQWVGLGGTEKTTIDDFRDRLGESVRELVTSGELEVDCEKGEPEDLEWND